MSKTRQEFKTIDHSSHEPINKIWKYSNPKESGIVKGGEHTGFYISEDEKKRVTKALIKQDRTIHNISEFLAGKVYQKLIPEYSANILLTKVGDSKEPTLDGNDVYVVSEFVPYYQGELYTQIQAELKRNTDRSKHALTEWLQIQYQQFKYLPAVFQRLTHEGHFDNFGEVNGASFILNNLDTHPANFIVVHKETKEQNEFKKLGVIDYGYAWRDMTTKINPHSFTKCLLTNAVRLEGWNNFIYYPRDIKITPSFVAGLDKMASIDLTNTVNAAFDELAQFYSIHSILQFMVKTNLISSKAADFYIKQNDNYNNERYTKYVLNLMKSKINGILKERQSDVLRFSAQIKMDLCLAEDKSHAPTKYLGGYEDPITNQFIPFDAVVFKHINYFLEVLGGKEKFKFRNPANQKSVLNDLVKNESAIVIASLICTNDVICEHYGIQTLDRAVELIQKGVLKEDNLFKSFQNPSAERMIESKKILVNNGSLIRMAKTNSLTSANQEMIIQLIKQGSNPNMTLPDGSKIIDHVNAKKDFLILSILVQNGARITRSVIKNVTPEQYSLLMRQRERFLRTQGKCFVFEPLGYFMLSLFSCRQLNQDDNQKQEEKEQKYSSSSVTLSS